MLSGSDVSLEIVHVRIRIYGSFHYYTDLLDSF